MPPTPTLHLRPFLRSTLTMLARRWASLLTLQVAFKVATLIVLGPLAVGVLNVLVARTGSAAVANLDIVGFLFTPAGMTALLLLPAGWLATVYVEQSATFAVLDDPEPGTPALRTARATRRVLDRLASVAGLAALQIGVVVMLAGLAGAAAWVVYLLLLGGADVNYYLYTRPPRFYVAVGLAGLGVMPAAGLAVWLYLRWYVALPVVLFEGARPVPALHESARRTAGRRTRILKLVALWLAARTLVLSGLAAALAGTSAFVVARTGGAGSFGGENLTLAVWAAGVMLLVNAGVLAVASAADRVVYAGVLKHIYRLTRRQVAPVPDPLPPRDSAPRPGSDPALGRRHAGALTLAAGAAGLVLAGLWSASQASELAHRQDAVVTAHRAGARIGPENTILAMERSLEIGVDWVEIDVQRSRDGTVWAVHDADLRRVAGSPLRVADATDRQLQRLRVAEDRPLATLDDFLSAAAGRAGLSIEVKYYGGFDEGLVPAVLEAVDRHDAWDRVNLISLDQAALRQARRLAPQVPTGFLVSTRLGDVTRLDVDFLSVNQTLLTRAFKARAARRGLPVAVWTVNSESDLMQALILGADELVTDDPRAAWRAIERFQELSDVEVVLLRLRAAVPG